MTQHLRLRIHVTEPWDFERANGTNELTGWTVDHADEENEEWEVTLDQSFEFREKQYSTILVGPRYVGDRKSVVQGKSVAVSVVLGGAGVFKKKHKNQNKKKKR